MLTEHEARERILGAVGRGPVERVPLIRAAAGGIVAETIRGDVALPGFDNSQVDGYAMKLADAKAGAELEICGEQEAGVDRGLAVRPGQAVRIFTGAPVPEGTEVVMMQESTERPREGRVRLLEAGVAGEFIRRRGSDFCAGQTVLRAGERLTPARVGVLASQGIAEVPVHCAPRCSVVTTGDELVSAGRALEPGQLYNSNGPMLAAALKEIAAPEVRVLHARDDRSDLERVLAEALEESDFCFVAGGVSVGDHDLVKPVLGELGVEGGFWRVKVKPGKPLFFGRRRDTMVFGLPGNPVSALVTFYLFAHPALRAWRGERGPAEGPWLEPVRVRMASGVENDGDRPHYLRGRLLRGERGLPEFRTTGIQQSHALYGSSLADGLVRLRAGGRLEEGAEAEAYRLPG